MREIINLFLAQFSRTLSPDEHAVMIWDGADFHRSHSVSIPDNIMLVQLPPYCPELAPHRTLRSKICGTLSKATTGAAAPTTTTSKKSP